MRPRKTTTGSVRTGRRNATAGDPTAAAGGAVPSPPGDSAGDSAGQGRSPNPTTPRSHRRSGGPTDGEPSGNETSRNEKRGRKTAGDGISSQSVRRCA